jgi:hypothetical protein
MGGVDAAARIVASATEGAGDEEGVGSRDDRLLDIAERIAFADERRRRVPRRRPFADRNIFRAIAVSLDDLDLDRVIANCRDNAVEAIASARREVDPEDADIGTADAP